MCRFVYSGLEELAELGELEPSERIIWIKKQVGLLDDDFCRIQSLGLWKINLLMPFLGLTSLALEIISTVCSADSGSKVPGLGSLGIG